MKKQTKYLLAALIATTSFSGCDFLENLFGKGSSSDTPSESGSVADSGSVAGSDTGSASGSQGGGAQHTLDFHEAGEYTFYDYLTISPSNWNELTYQDSNDTNIMSWIGGSFFSFDFKFDDDGNPIDGEFDVKLDALEDIEDVTSMYAGSEEWGVPADANANYAFKFTLRDNLKWDDGTEIHAKDFVYTMKQQLDPLFKNYRADSFYGGSMVIHNAKEYVYQGDSDTYDAVTALGETYNSEWDDQLVFNFAYDPEGVNNAIFSDLDAEGYGKYLVPDALAGLVNLYGAGPFDPDDKETVDLVAEMNGKTIAEIKDNPTYKAVLDTYLAWWQEDDDGIMDCCVADKVWPAVDFDNVGLFVGDDENELIIVLDKAIEIFDGEGNLTYHAPYEFGSLPLVKEDLYESCKQAPQAGATLWTSNYNSSLATTASWGPYSLTQFQSGKSFTLEKNPYWYGNDIDLYDGKYQCTRIYTEIIEQYETAFLKFKSGLITSVGLDVSVAADYKSSQRAIFTPSDYVGSLQMQSSATALKAREEKDVDKEILTNVNFRKAFSLAFDRDAYATECTTSSLAGYGLFNTMHYYDVAAGRTYRSYDDAKRTLCEVYSIDVEDYEGDLDKAVAAIGKDMEKAKALLIQAYNEELLAGTISATDNVVITIGGAVDNIATQRQVEFIKKTFNELAKETPLEGRISCEYKVFGNKWSSDFRNGAFDICTGGWTGAAWDPGFFLLAYLGDNYRYAYGWDPSKTNLTLEIAGSEYTMSLDKWYDCLNGAASAAHDWSLAGVAAGTVTDLDRVHIIAALEAEVLKTYYAIPTYNTFSAGLVSYQVEYFTKSYNTFVGYGGIKYMTFNYDDAEWEAYLAANTLDYTK